jgi:hypothetical protein
MQARKGVQRNCRCFKKKKKQKQNNSEQEKGVDAYLAHRLRRGARRTRRPTAARRRTRTAGTVSRQSTKPPRTHARRSLPPPLPCFCSTPCGADGVEALSVSRLPPPRRGCRSSSLATPPLPWMLSGLTMTMRWLPCATHLRSLPSVLRGLLSQAERDSTVKILQVGASPRDLFDPISHAFISYLHLI